MLFPQMVGEAQSLPTSFAVPEAVPEVRSETEAVLPGLALQQLHSGDGNCNTDANSMMQVSLSLSEWVSIVVSGLFAWNFKSLVASCKTHN